MTTMQKSEILYTQNTVYLIEKDLGHPNTQNLWPGLMKRFPSFANPPSNPSQTLHKHFTSFLQTPLNDLIWFDRV